MSRRAALRLGPVALVFVLEGALAFVSEEAAALQARVSPRQLCSLADAVVVAEVTSVFPQWSEGADGSIETLAYVSVEQVVVGDPAGTAEIVLPGGEIGDIRHWVEDVPHLQVDVRYLLYLVRHPQGTWTPIGGERFAIPLPAAGEPGARKAVTAAVLSACSE